MEQIRFIEIKPDTAHATLELLYNTKSENEKMAWKVVQEIEDGNVSGLKVLLSIKSIENLLKQLTDKETNEELSTRFKSLILEEADKYSNKTIEMHGAKFTKTESGTRYDFSKCGDAEWDDYNSRIKELEEKRKKREEYLKGIPESGVRIVEQDEVIELFPPVRTSTSTISVTIPK